MNIRKNCSEKYTIWIANWISWTINSNPDLKNEF